jgi:hypothetical protein
MAVQSNGKIVLAGRAYDGTRDYAALARYTSDGKLDAEFGPAPSVSIGDVSLSEGNTGTTAFNFTVTLSSVSGVPVTVQYATTNGTATAGSDYTATTTGSTVTIPAGQLSATITVSVIGDTVKEANETFYVNLSSPVGATIADGQGVGTIINDDGKTRTSTVMSAADAVTAPTASDLALATPTSAFVSVAPVTSTTVQPAVETSPATASAAVTTVRRTATDRSVAELADLDLALDTALTPVLDELIVA